MDHAPQRFTAEELQAALGDKPFVVRDMWQGQPPSAGPPPDPDAPELRQAAEAAEASELRQPAARSDPAPPEQGFAADLAAESRPTKARRWPLVALAAASLAGACVAVLWLITIGAPPRGTQRTAAAPLALNTTNPTPATFAPEASAPVLPSDSAAATAPPPEVPLPAEPPTTGAPLVAAVDAFATPDTPRPSNPILAAALLQRAEDALARKDIAAARAFFVRAASVDPWSAEASVGAGKTYDPGFLQPLGAGGGLADPAQARQWYDRALRLGDPAAAVLAGRLGEGR